MNAVPNRGDGSSKSGQDMQVLIIGGGVAGLTAACALSEWGAKVHLVEKGGHLGGKAFGWACMATVECQNCGACLSAELVESIRKSINCRVYLETEIGDIKFLGNQIEAHLKGCNPGVLTVDAVLLAIGFETFDPSSMKTLNYANNRKIITTGELNAILKREDLARFLDDNPSPSIAFIQCVGSRNREEGRDYCSQVCCRVALRQVNKIIDLIPGARVTIFYIDLQIIGKEIRRQFELLGEKAALLQGVPAEILTGFEGDKLTVIREDDENGKRAPYHFDAVILSVGMVPSQDSRSLCELLKIRPGQWGFLGGKEMDFPDGVYSAGAICGPMDILKARQQGLRAAHDIAVKIGLFEDALTFPSVAVIGDGPHMIRITDKLRSDGYEVKPINTGNNIAGTYSGSEAFSNSRLLSVEGTAGEFLIRIDSNNEKRSIRCDAIVVAPEAARERPAIDVHEDRIAENITGLDRLEERLNEDAEVPQKIAFWLDNANPEGKADSRRVVQLAIRLAEQGKDVSIIMKNMLVHGSDGQKIYDMARQKGVKFIRTSGKGQPVLSWLDGNVRISLQEATLGGMKADVECALVVMPSRVRPGMSNNDIGKIVHVELDKEGYFQNANTRYRMISDPRAGIFLLGEDHDELDESDFTNEIRELEICLDGIRKKVRPMHCGAPAEIDDTKCSRCLTCLRICPHYAIYLKDPYKPHINPDACSGCGKCVSACPANAITRTGEKDVSAKMEGKCHKTVIFACGRSSALAGLEAMRLEGCPANDISVITVPCAGSVSTQMIFNALLEGYDHVIVAGCHEGNCCSGNGVMDARRRISGVIRDTGIPDGQVSSLSIAANEPEKFLRVTSSLPDFIRQTSDKD